MDRMKFTQPLSATIANVQQARVLASAVFAVNAHLAHNSLQSHLCHFHVPTDGCPVQRRPP